MSFWTMIFYIIIVYIPCQSLIYIIKIICNRKGKNAYQSPQGGFISEVDLDEIIAKYKSLCLEMQDRIEKLNKDLKQCRDENKQLKEDMKSLLADSQSMPTSSMIRTNAKKEGG